MASHGLMKFIYILGIAGIIFWSISLFQDNGTVGIVSGIVVLVFGNLFWRIICEFLILLFSLHQLVERAEKHLKEMIDMAKGK